MSKKGAGKYRKKFIEPFVLLIIAENPMHGYEIANKLFEYGIELTGLGQMGNIYRILSKLESEGFVISKWDNSSQGPSKKIYYITKKGIEQLLVSKDEFINIISKLETFIEKVSKFTENVY
ncbi:PadR family transcriptional regulator [Thermosipho melanesiensis]|uniref:Transcriptional regulator, PadR-like family n=2 Tax=Thermosipho melanesiensis TaxID=46541 RepID=A6LMD0_THEM4|nr:PadR family transcriptional regulator [Thermosipho melanesiensis]ABR31081.1 transcriptional regulator, PadR-like family [Thermosipho melanesiensis BI429]APT74176.1 PadR family transcriptional regulator [Thermosipho melanesiensis]OOC36120.1 PadR family transcriptional regulator [Thermosipho melanesiensis]OOC36937.1 PadR family transcriptional regulator [Thermosipho melanesiensis]OOC37689.1 PadR family transcriptional regulator [Thermosipho melanesiensis]